MKEIVRSAQEIHHQVMTFARERKTVRALMEFKEELALLRQLPHPGPVISSRFGELWHEIATHFSNDMRERHTDVIKRAEAMCMRLVDVTDEEIRILQNIFSLQ